MAHHPLLIEILVGINHQDTPSSLSRHTPAMTIYHLQKDPFYLDADADNCPSDRFQHSLLKDHVGYQYQKYGCLGYAQRSDEPATNEIYA